jgi:hypothetical protein
MNLLEKPSTPGADFLFEIFMELSSSCIESGISRLFRSFTDSLEPETMGLKIARRKATVRTVEHPSM